MEITTNSIPTVDNVVSLVLWGCYHWGDIMEAVSKVVEENEIGIRKALPIHLSMQAKERRRL